MSSTSNPAVDFFNSAVFDDRANSLIKEWHVPGLSAAIVHHDEITSKAFGFAVLESQKRCTIDTLFDIASSSKSTTAGAVALLVDDDENFPQVQWDTPMSSLLPDDFVLSQDEYTKQVTVEDILSHRSGLPRHDDFYFGSRSSHPDTPRSITRNLRHLPISAPIRTKEQYNNSLYTVASYLIEKLSSKTFEDFLHERIWGPLGMTSTNLLPDGAKEAGLGDQMAFPYQWKKAKNEHQVLEFEQTPEAIGAGSIWTTPKDYGLWVKAVMNQESPLNQEIYESVTMPRIISNPGSRLDKLAPFTSFTSYATGWETYFYRGKQVIEHDGAISGFSCTVFFLPEYKFGGCIFGNSEDAGSIATVLMRDLVDHLLEVPQVERIEWNAHQHKVEDKAREEQKEEQESLRKELSANGDGISEPQKIPLSAYTGEYWNVGYKGITVQIKDNHLHIDASDRSMAFKLDLEHMFGQTIFIGTIFDALSAMEEVDKIKVEFRFGQGNQTVRIGLHQESDLDDLIWYDKVEDASEEIAVR